MTTRAFPRERHAKPGVVGKDDERPRALQLQRSRCHCSESRSSRAKRATSRRRPQRRHRRRRACEPPGSLRNIVNSRSLRARRVPRPKPARSSPIRIAGIPIMMTVSGFGSWSCFGACRLARGLGSAVDLAAPAWQRPAWQRPAWQCRAGSGADRRASGSPAPSSVVVVPRQRQPLHWPYRLPSALRSASSASSRSRSARPGDDEPLRSACRPGPVAS